jgi:hypothetical protein
MYSTVFFQKYKNIQTVFGDTVEPGTVSKSIKSLIAFYYYLINTIEIEIEHILRIAQDLLHNIIQCTNGIYN